MKNPFDFIDNLSSKKCENFTRTFLHFYINNGFGSRSKSDIDCEIFNLMCQYNIIDVSLPPIALGLTLKTSATNINKYREYMFYQGKLAEKQQKDDLLKVLSNNLESISREKWFVFSVHNATTKLYLENILQSKDKNYDYSFNSSNIKLSVATFVEIYTMIGGDIKKAVNELLKDKQFEKEYPEERTTIINITQQREWGVVRLLDIMLGLANSFEIIKNLFNYLHG